MKALLKKTIGELVVGTYDVVIDDDIEGVSKQFAVWRKFSSGMPLVKEYDSLEELLDDWFVFQELPEQLKTRVRNAIEENAGATAYMPSTEEQEEMSDDALNAVCAVLEGEQ